VSRSKPLRRPPAPPRDDGPMTLEQWLAGGRARLMVSRKDLVVFSEAYLHQRVVPLIADCLKTYEKERRRNRWWRRAWRWLGTRVLGDPVVEPASAFLDAMNEEIEDAAAEVAEEQASEEEAPLPRSCAVCGSYQLEPVNQDGGLKCDRGHVIEEPPPAPGMVPVSYVPPSTLADAGYRTSGPHSRTEADLAAEAARVTRDG